MFYSSNLLVGSVIPLEPQVVLNAAAKVLFHCSRLPEALALYRDAEALGTGGHGEMGQLKEVS